MFGFLKSKRPARTGPVLRSFLRMEELSDRAMPSDLLGTEPPPPPPPPPGPVTPPPPAQTAPVIDTFIASEVAHGWYTISGHVTGNNVTGLVVRFEGIPALDNVTATVDANGNFSVTFPVATNGSDSGTIAAQTTQNGVNSQYAFTYMSPTP
jgi:hypothetical protein